MSSERGKKVIEHKSTRMCNVKFLHILLCISSIISFYDGEAQVSLPSGVPANADILLWLSPDTALYRGNGSVANVGQRVDKWHDISGNGFIFDAPSFTNRPRLITDAGFRYLDFVNGDFFENTAVRDSINGLDEFSIFMVVKSDQTNTDNGFLDSEDPNGTDDKICLRYDANGANTGRTNLLKSGLGGNLASQQVETQNNTQTTDRQVLTITWSINDRLRVYINGVLNDTSQNTINSALSGINKIIIGKGPKNTGGTSGWDGKIGTLIFFKEEFSQDTIDAISQTIETVTSVQSGLWTSASTWDCNCVPQPENNVEVSNGDTVTIASNVTADNVVINSGGTLDGGNSNYEITLTGDLTNNGEYIYGDSKIILSHNAAQRIVGNINLFDLQIDNTVSTSLESGASIINGTLTVNNGNLITNGNLILNSDASGDGRINAIGSASITGDATIRRYIDAGSTDWRFLSSPVQNATISDWNSDFITSGFPGSDYPSFPFTSIYRYDESVSGIKDNGFVAPSGLSETLIPGRGFTVYSGDTSTGTQPFTIDVTGSVGTGNVTIPVSFTDDLSQPLSEDGWNLVGNPYASSIDWDSPNWNRSNLDDAIYIYNPDLQTYSSYVNGVGTNGGSNLIASSQAFWVKANALSPSLEATQNVKSASSASFFKRILDRDVIKLSFGNSSCRDEFVLVLDERASETFESDKDAYKIHNNRGCSEILLIQDSVEYSINSVPLHERDVVYSVSTIAVDSGWYSFSSEISGIGQYACLYFEDRVENKMILLDNNFQYRCLLNKGITSNRFLIHVGAKPQIIKPTTWCKSDTVQTITAIAPGNRRSRFIWSDDEGRILRNRKQLVSKDSLEISSAGDYFVKILQEEGCPEQHFGIHTEHQLDDSVDFSMQIDTLAQGYMLHLHPFSNNHTSIFWTINGKEIESTNSMAYFLEPGAYRVTLFQKFNSNCDYSLSKSILLAELPKIGVEERPRLQAFPIPTRSILNFNKIIDGEIINAKGEVIYKFIQVQSVDLNSLNSGSYWIKSTEGEVLSIIVGDK